MGQGPPPLDLAFLTPLLAIGARPTPPSAHRLSAIGVRAVVELAPGGLGRRDGPRLARLCLPTASRRAPSSEQLARGVRFVQRHLSRGEKVLVQGERGGGRSVVLACCVLVAEGASPDAALGLVQRARPTVSPSAEQLAALRAFARRLASA